MEPWRGPCRARHVRLTSLAAPRRKRAGPEMTREAFERLVDEAVTLIPARFRAEMQNLALVVEDQPAADLLGEMGIYPPDTLYGLYQGTPLTERHWSQGNNLPDRI